MKEQTREHTKKLEDIMDKPIGTVLCVCVCVCVCACVCVVIEGGSVWELCTSYD